MSGMSIEEFNTLFEKVKNMPEAEQAEWIKENGDDELAGDLEEETPIDR